MAEYPAMTLWTDSYLADTRHLSTEEHGAYLLLLMAMWRSPDGWLEDDDHRLARMAGLGVKKWRRIRPALADMLKVENGRVSQKRLLEERERAESLRNQKRQAGQASAQARSKKPSPVRDTQDEVFEIYERHRAESGEAITGTDKSPKNKDKGATDVDAPSPRRGNGEATTSSPSPSPPSAPNGAAHPGGDPDADLYQRARQVIGPKHAGAVVSKLKTHFGGSIPRARAAVEQASEKARPKDWLMGIVNKRDEREDAGSPFI
jgi:uncharacterized protein YdaU (DUF1376 family)